MVEPLNEKALKALDWKYDEEIDAYAANSALGRYLAYWRRGGKYFWCRTLGQSEPFDTLEAAQSAAQADFSQRILSSIEPLPLSPETVERKLSASERDTLHQAWVASTTPHEPATLMICPDRDAVCPHGLECPYAGRYGCSDPSLGGRS